MVNSVVAQHAQGKHEEDIIFSINGKAQEAIQKYGKENVVNATIGAVLEDDETLGVIPTVMEVFRNLPASEIVAYAPIAGLPDFLKAAQEVTFRKSRPEAYIEAIATPGGTGAIRHAFWNYLDEGQAALTSDWFWGPYRTIANENHRKLETFEFFTEDLAFNFSSFEARVTDLAARQDNLLVIINAPSHNPTGYSLTMEEWQGVLEILGKVTEEPAKKVVLFCDIAYLDFAGDQEKSREFMKLFTNLPTRLLVVLAFSMSKSYTIYGLRTGAMIGVSSDKEVITEFKNTNMYSNRGTWSNGTRSGMKLLTSIVNNPELFTKVEAERMVYKKLIEDRAAIFLREAQEVGLDMLPYKGGFFLTIPASKPKEAVDLLMEQNIFPVPLGKGGIRVAICAVPTGKVPGLAAKFKEAIDRTL